MPNGSAAVSAMSSCTLPGSTGTCDRRYRDRPDGRRSIGSATSSRMVRRASAETPLSVTLWSAGSVGERARGQPGADPHQRRVAVAAGQGRRGSRVPECRRARTTTPSRVSPWVPSRSTGSSTGPALVIASQRRAGAGPPRSRSTGRR